MRILPTYKGWRGAARAVQMLEKELAAGHEHPERHRERLGKTDIPRPKGPLIWFHAHDDSEAFALPELIKRLHADQPDLHFLITTARFDPALTLEKRLPAGTIHQYLPYEPGPGIGAFLDHWHPDAVVWSDHDIRPRIIEAAFTEGLPLFLINACVADEKQQRMRWFPGSAKSLLRRFDRILTVNQNTADTLRRLGVAADRLDVTGVLLEGSAPLPCVESERDALGDLVATRPVWLAAGIDAAEEKTVIEAHRRALRRSHRLLLIIVPADRARGERLAERLGDEGWSIALRSREEEPDPEIQIYIADLPGEMGLWYRLAPIAFSGQSLAKGPGRNPYEATALGSAVLHGPGVKTWRESYARLHRGNAAREVRDVSSLTTAVEELLNPDKAAEMATAAWEITTSGAEVTDRITTLLFHVLDERGPTG